MTSLRRIAQPSTEPLTLAQAKLFLRVTDTSEDAYITALITVCREMIEDYTRQAFRSQTWKLTTNEWPDVTLWLPRAPLLSVESVKYYPADGGAQLTLSASLYHVSTGLMPGCITLKENESWPDLAVRPDAVEVNFTAGHADDTEPKKMVQALRLLISNFFENRVPVIQGTIVGEVPMSAQWLMQSCKITGFVV